MNFEGLFPKFKVNRPLTSNEISYRLYQNRKLILGDNDLCDDISVIEINSLYMDTVNKFYKNKGWGTISTLLFILFCTGACLFFGITGSHSSEGTLKLFGLSMAFFSPLIIFAIFCLLKESFTWTHYPIRFNREKQLLSVFRPDGTVLTAPWNSIFFTTGRDIKFGDRTSEIRGHILDKDNITVLETFNMGTDGAEHDVYRYWEFVRRYMSLPEGPSEIIDRLTYCLPIDGKREGYLFGLWRLHVTWNGGASIFSLPFFPITFVVSIARYVAMVTSKIPHWPDEIKQQNSIISSDDRYARTAKDNKPLIWWWNTVWD